MMESKDQQWLLSFHRVYELHSFKQAAEQLGLPASNVSRHVALLEERLNVRLLERTTRRMSPTPAGEHLYHSTVHLLCSLNEVLEEVRLDAQSVTGHLRVLMPDIPFLGDAAVQFCTDHPTVSLSCETSLSPKEALCDGFDLILAFGRGRLIDKSWVAREVARWQSVVVGSPDLIDKVGAPYALEDLKQTPCISSLTALQGMPWVFKGHDAQPIKQAVRSTFKVNSGYMAKSAAINHLGFAILPKESCEHELQQGRLIELELQSQPEDLVLYAFYTGRKHQAKKVTVFIDYLQKVKTQSE
ncbi:LysR family transcriptional regulator [Vibrio ostreicida]|uniref:LysR family transcriptional regulator n=1 Tax=Vibrio ostreicida TaxID=526588 RepID=A0ABT8BZG1_9VIBR|nr:LysR family transcriptional regulator [Vibrio ostreicida]MDN3612073.1 LysR family transcriptional regulator [Vibrio ostreicida]NPD08756.1 LysR family transcriptional regulator [Vibrio ostreicida]